jgi:hypothetical protein
VCAFVAAADGIISMDGSAGQPFCSWGSGEGCPGPWEEVRNTCAEALCQLNNYTTGVWLADSGDMCTTMLEGIGRGNGVMGCVLLVRCWKVPGAVVAGVC